MDSPLCAALIHYPVTDKHGLVVSTAITNLDIHDISRASRTYGVRRYYLVTPVEAQHWLARRVIEHWDTGWGAGYNPNRREALEIIQTKTDIGAVEQDMEELYGRKPLWVATSARRYPNTATYADLRRRVQDPADGPFCLMFGTGWGLHPELIMEADLILEPIVGPTEYNHLSVRSAASIIFDRLLAPDRT
jgi:hypothetical protein